MARCLDGVLWISVACLLSGCGGEEAPNGGTPVVADDTGASITLGGEMYDTFWKVSSAPEPKQDHPLWAQRPDADANASSGSATWRCKECHGWDYKGVDGAYAKGSHRTGFPGIHGNASSEAQILDSLAGAHGYRDAGLGDEDLRNLARFVREGLVDVAQWIDENGAFRGDAARGQKLYMQGLGSNRACSACHGSDGLGTPKGAAADFKDFVGVVAKENPPEFLHKVRFGQPGTKMPAAHMAGVPMQDVIDLCAYAQSLPPSR